MSTWKSRVTLAAALAITSLPALADVRGTCAVCDDGTWPSIENPAPALALRADGGEAEALRAADPTWPETGIASPAIFLQAYPEDGPQVDPMNPMIPDVKYAAAMTEPQRQESRVAAR
jgi:hypothetical protein